MDLKSIFFINKILFFPDIEGRAIKMGDLRVCIHELNRRSSMATFRNLIIGIHDKNSSPRQILVKTDRLPVFNQVISGLRERDFNGQSFRIPVLERAQEELRFLAWFDNLDL